MAIAFDFFKRGSDLQKNLQADNIEAMFCVSSEHIFYFTGYSRQDAYLLITAAGMYLFTDPRYQNDIAGCRPACKVNISPNPLKNAASLVKKRKFKTLGFEEEHLTYQMHATLKKQLPAVRLKPGLKYIKNLTAVKDTHEIKAISQACRFAGKALEELRRINPVGKTEQEIAAHLTHYLVSLGSEVAAYEPIVASGPRSAMPHAKTTSARIQKASGLLIDVGAKAYNYNSDLTRVYTFSKMKPEFERIYRIVAEAQDRALAAARPGASASFVDKAARQTITNYGYGRNFIHATGHGIGLYVHESPAISPKSKECLKPGMVFTIEPGIYIAGKFGIRIEDIVAITTKGCKVLSHGISRAI